MTSNRDKAAEIITPWIEKEWGSPEDNAESAADALAAAGVLAPDVDPDRVHTIGRITIIETGSDRTSVTAWGGVVTIVDEVAGDLAGHSPELAAENAMTIEEVDGMIAALNAPCAPSLPCTRKKTMARSPSRRWVVDMRTTTEFDISQTGETND